MPFKRKRPLNPNGDITNLDLRLNRLKQRSKDVTLSPTRRLLSCLTVMWLTSTGNKQKVLQALLLGNNGIVFDDNEGTIKNIKYHKKMLGKIEADVNMPPHRAFFVSMLLLWLCATGEKEEQTRRMLLGFGFSQFFNNSGIKYTDNKDGKGFERTAAAQETTSSILDVLRGLEEDSDERVQG